MNTSVHIIASIICICLLRCCFTQITGLQRAVQILRAPIVYKDPSKDIILDNLIDHIAHDSYKLQILRMRIGYAWEWILTDYGFIKQADNYGFDLLSHTRKIALELKNNYRINSHVKRENIAALQRFKQEHPDYEVILGVINYKNNQGKISQNGDVQLLYGRPLIQRFFNADAARFNTILRRMRNAVQSHF